MNHVRSQPLLSIAESLAKLKGLSTQDLLMGSLVTLSELRDSSRAFSWEVTANWMNWLDQVHGPVDWRLVGANVLETPSLPAVRKILQACFSLRLCYWVGNHWLGPSRFPGIQLITYEESAPNQIQYAIERPAGPACDALFEIFAGLNSAFPKKVFQLPEAQVLLSVEGRLAHYKIQLPAQNSLWSWLNVGLRSLLSARAIFGELSEQAQQLREAFGKIESDRRETHHLLEHFPDGIIIHDDDGVVYLNSRMLHYLGATPGYALGKPALELLTPAYQKAAGDRIEFLKSRQQSMNPPAEFHFVRPHSPEPFVGETTSVRMNYNGKPSIVVIVRDLTERNKLQEQLMHQDRLSGLGRLAASVGHEINNPLSYALLNVAQIENSAALTKPMSEHLAEVRKGLERIQYIVRDLKTVSRGPRSEAPVPVDLCSVLETAINMTRNLIQSRATLKTEISELPHLMGNEAKLAQVFVNLLINAAEAIELGPPSNHEITVRAFTLNESQVVVQIQDSGCGMPAEIKGRIFDPFFTTKPVGQGTGLGLSICHSVVQQFGGTITVTSELNRGTLMQVIFPVASGREWGHSPSGEPSLLRGRVLLVDDNIELLASLKALVERRHVVVTAHDGAEALKAIKDGEDFDCIFCDLMMPRISGVAFYHQLLILRPELCSRIIFMTGGSFTPETDHFLRQPRIQHIEKPLSLDDVLARIDELIRRGPSSKIHDQ